MGVRRAGREAAVKILYAVEFGEKTRQDAIEEYWQGHKGSPKLKEFTSKLVNGVCENREPIDEMINGASENWPVSRMGEVDRNIMRVAAFEIMECPEVPPSVVINEAVEMARIYVDKESALFINGVLGKILSETEMLKKQQSGGK